jgi:HSP20 family molecular chaperone IbpA
MDEMWKDMDWFFNRPLQLENGSSTSKFENRGLKRIIKRPHSLITKKDNNGNVIGYALELPYTPFAKDEVNVEVKDNVLCVTCGKENKTRNEEMDFSDISYQMFSFSIPLSDSVDANAITATANDGMLRIDLPAKMLEEKKPNVLKIEVK